MKAAEVVTLALREMETLHDYRGGKWRPTGSRRRKALLRAMRRLAMRSIDDAIRKVGLVMERS